MKNRIEGEQCWGKRVGDINWQDTHVKVSSCLATQEIRIGCDCYNSASTHRADERMTIIKKVIQLFTGTTASIKASLHDVAVPGLIPHTAPKAFNTAVAEPSELVKLGLHGPGALLIGGLSLSPLFQKIFST